MGASITVGGRRFELYSFTGEVLTSEKGRSTAVHGGGGGGYSHGGTGYTAPVSISSTTTVHDQLFLRDAEVDEVQDDDLGISVSRHRMR
jgi:hypothetical protein